MPLVFLHRDLPAVTAVARKLLSRPAVSRDLVLVPTRESGRQLREHLASLSEKKALLSPRIIPIGQFLRPSSPEAADGLSELASWFAALRQEAPFTRYPRLFPKAPSRSANSLLNLSRRFLELRNSLAESGVSFETMRTQSEEPSRWDNLIELNDKALLILKSWGMTPKSEALRQELKSPSPHRLPETGGSLIVACVPVLGLPVRRFLSRCAQWDIPVELWVHAAPEEARLFDNFGCPGEGWLTRPADLSAVSQPVTETAAQLGEKIVEFIHDLGEQESSRLSLGICDPRFASPLDTCFREKGWTLFFPSGKPFRGTGLMQLLDCLRKVLDLPDSFSSRHDLARSSLLFHTLQKEGHYEFCRLLDDLKSTHLPETCTYARTLIEQRDRENKTTHLKTWDLLDQWVLSLMTPRSLGARLEAWGEELSDSLTGEEEQTVLSLFQTAVRSLKNLQEKSPDFVDSRTALLLLEESLSTAAIPARQRPQNALDALGWAELPFCPGKHLILTGLSEGVVPEGPPDDPFLPDSLRKRAGLPTGAAKQARDHFLFASLIDPRLRNGGRICLPVCRQTPDNEPLTPSTLLLKCPPETLPERVRHLFGPGEGSPRPLPYDRGDWVLSPPGGWSRAELLQHNSVRLLAPGYSNPWAPGERQKPFSPSTLKRFLNCPLRFWVNNIFRLDRVSPQKPDKEVMEHNELGSLAHAILEQFGQAFPRLSPGLTREKLKQEMASLVEKLFSEQYGDQGLLPLKVQKYSLLKRLDTYAALHWDHLLSGWECVEFEREVTGWTLSGYPMKFRIDRIDRHPDGRCRVIDYKTGSKTASCEKSHLTTLSDNAKANLPLLSPELTPFLHPENARRVKPSPHRWSDLQLPLYVLWAREQYGEDVSAAYYALPGKTRDIRLSLWDRPDLPLDGAEESALDSARTWAVELMRLISSGEGLVSAEELDWQAPSFDLLSSGREPLRETLGLTPSPSGHA